MLWVEEGLSPADQLSAPPAVFKEALALVNERRRAQAEQAKARDDKEAYDRLHSLLGTGG